MNYEQKYKEALEKAKKFYNNEGCRVGMTPIDLEVIFPELKESEGEKIRIHIAGKFEPRFKDGDWIIFNGLTLYIKEVVQGYYRTISKGGIINSYDWDIDNVARLWTTKEARDGNVLVHSSFMFDDFIFIYNKTSNLQAYCYYSKERNRFIIEDRGHYCPWNMQEVTPANKEQRDLLFAKMKEAGYKWNTDEKVINKVIIYE